MRSWREAGERWGRLGRALAEGGRDDERLAAALFVPGRVEMLGKHTDYAGGRSLVAATRRGLSLLIAPRVDSALRWRDLTRGIEVRFDVADPGERPGHWSNYLRTAVRRAAADFGPPRRGLDVAMTSDLPASSGLSSSSALVVAGFLALDAVNDIAATPRFRAEIGDRNELAGYLGAVEGGAPFRALGRGAGVGTFGGSEDHTAILGSRSGCLRQYRFSPVHLELEVEMPASWALLVGTSGVRAKKTGAARERFNRLAALAAAGAAAWRRSTGGAEKHLGAALAVAGSAEVLAREVEAGLRPGDPVRDVLDRVAHFAQESGQLVPAAAGAFAAADGEALRAIARRSHASADELLGNQVAETRALASLAAEAGALATSAFGAGFGGAVWAIAQRDEAERFVERWRAAYTAKFPGLAAESRFFSSSPGPGVHWPTGPGPSTRATRSGVTSAGGGADGGNEA